MTSDEVQSLALRALSQFDEAPLFSRCGAELELPDAAVEVLEWENTRIDAANLLHSQIRTHLPDQMNLWNDHVIAIKPQLIEMVHRKLSPWMRSRALPQKVENCVRWDLLHLCLYEGHKPHVSIPFYDEMKRWYLAGHLPCGWRGDFPEGQFLVH